MKYLTLILLLASCTTLPPTPPAQEEKTPVQEACPVKVWCYTQATKDALTKYGQALLAASPKDYQLYCGTAAKLDCYDAILHAMSVYESGIDPNQVYTEKFKDVKGAFVISTGLEQVSLESCHSYGASAKSTEELKDPAKNLECAVRILNRWVVSDGVISGGAKGAWRGGARYWSVLREHVPDIRAKALGYLR